MTLNKNYVNIIYLLPKRNDKMMYQFEFLRLVDMFSTVIGEPKNLDQIDKKGIEELISLTDADEEEAFHFANHLEFIQHVRGGLSISHDDFVQFLALFVQTSGADQEFATWARGLLD